MIFVRSSWWHSRTLGRRCHRYPPRAFSVSSFQQAGPLNQYIELTMAKTDFDLGSWRKEGLGYHTFSSESVTMADMAWNWRIIAAFYSILSSLDLPCSRILSFRDELYKKHFVRPLRVLSSTPEAASHSCSIDCQKHCNTIIRRLWRFRCSLYWFEWVSTDSLIVPFSGSSRYEFGDLVLWKNKARKT